MDGRRRARKYNSRFSGPTLGVSGQWTCSSDATSFTLLVPGSKLAIPLWVMSVMYRLPLRSVTIPSVFAPIVLRSRTACRICWLIESGFRRTRVGKACTLVPAVTVQYRVAASGDSAMPLIPINKGLFGHTSKHVLPIMERQGGGSIVICLKCTTSVSS